MRIGVLKETAARERRVALVPDTVARLVKRGLEVRVTRDAGVPAFFGDAAYVAAGATLVDPAEAADADVVVAVQRPGPQAAAQVREGAVLAALFGQEGGDTVEALNRRRVSALSLERVPRITRAQSMDVLSSQATVAGYQAVLLGTQSLPRFLPMLTTAAGSIPPGRVLVLGAGVAGLQAIATARRLGAIVSGFDVRAAAAEQVESLGARFIAPQSLPADAEASGGYARELAEDQQRRVQETVAAALDQVDLVIATAAIPGRPAPLILTREMVELMKPGSVIVDVAAETGGNCALTEPGSTVVHGEVTVVGPLNLASTMPQHASQMFSRNVQTLIEHLVPGDELVFDLNDEITGAMCIAHEGATRQRGN